MAIYFDKKYIIPDIDIDVLNNKLMLLENNLLKKSWTNFLANLYTFDKNYYNYTVQLDYFGKLFFLNSQLLIIKDFLSVLNLTCFKNNITINKLINSYKNKIIKHQHYLKR